MRQTIARRVELSLRAHWQYVCGFCRATGLGKQRAIIQRGIKLLQGHRTSMQRRTNIRRVRKKRRRGYVLADLFRAVRRASKNDLETMAVITHLLEHGRVRFITGDRKVKVRIC
jgi:hypothetical protein